MSKRYLGDSVYADFDGYHVVLTTENGSGPSNRIFLEPSVLAELNAFVAERDVEAQRASHDQHELDMELEADESAHLRSLPPPDADHV